jgi:glycosyltransferase involved in cell wall biosynthesis
MKKQIFIYILIRGYKSFKYFDKCIDSVLSQSYKNYKILFADDASNYSLKQVKHIKRKLQKHVVVINKKRVFSLCNAYNLIQEYATNSSAIIFNLDADDWLLTGALETIANIYKNNPKCQLTYGECLVWDGSNVSKRTSRHIIPNTNIPYSNALAKDKSYRLEPFFPLHPRTWKVSLFKSIPKSEFLDSKKKWLRFAEDQAILFPMLERAGGNYKVISKPLYVYNKANIHADVTENTISLLRDEIEIRKKHSKTRRFNNIQNKINIYYHKALSLPFVDKFLYIAQITCLKNNIINNIFVSLKSSSLRDELLSLLNSNSILVVKSSKLSPILKNIYSHKILDDTSLKLTNQNIEYLYDIMWTLVYCDAVTSRTKHVIEKMLPSNYPTAKKL